MVPRCPCEQGHIALAVYEALGLNKDKSTVTQQQEERIGMSDTYARGANEEVFPD